LAKAAIELHPVSGKKAIEAARLAGLAALSIPTVLVQGDNGPGLGHAIAKALGDVGINLNFVLVQVVGRKYAAVFGFENYSDVAKAIALIRMAAAPARKALTRLRSAAKPMCGPPFGAEIRPLQRHRQFNKYLRFF